MDLVRARISILGSTSREWLGVCEVGNGALGRELQRGLNEEGEVKIVGMLLQMPSDYGQS